MQRLVVKIVVVLLILVVFVDCGKSDKPQEAVPQATAGQQIAPDPVRDGAPPQGGIAVPAQAVAGATPSIRFEQTEFDFGEAQAGKDVEHLFPFKNVGTATLVINKVGST